MAETCITADDVLNYPACCALEICCDTATIENEICCAIALVELITCMQICPVDECRIFKGTDSSLLFFQTENLQNLTSVTFDTCCEDNCFCGCTDPETIDLPTNFSSYLEYECCEATFPCGKISVCGTWGDVVNPLVRKAIIFLTLEAISPGITGLVSSQSGLTKETWSDYSAEYNTDDLNLSETTTTGFPEIDNWLDLATPTKSKMSIIDISNCPKCRKGSCGC